MLLHHTLENGNFMAVSLTVIFAQDLRLDTRVVCQPMSVL